MHEVVEEDGKSLKQSMVNQVNQHNQKVQLLHDAYIALAGQSYNDLFSSRFADGGVRCPSIPPKARSPCHVLVRVQRRGCGPGGRALDRLRRWSPLAELEDVLMQTCSNCGVIEGVGVGGPRLNQLLGWCAWQL